MNSPMEVMKEWIAIEWVSGAFLATVLTKTISFASGSKRAKDPHTVQG